MCQLLSKYQAVDEIIHDEHKRVVKRRDPAHRPQYKSERTHKTDVRQQVYKLKLGGCVECSDFGEQKWENYIKSNVESGVCNELLEVES